MMHYLDANTVIQPDGGRSDIIIMESRQEFQDMLEGLAGLAGLMGNGPLR